MALYRLYVESGPRRKKTMVHVLDLLGCVATGPTTEAALERTPQAIRSYLRFLRRHGELTEFETDVQLQVEEHITEGVWLGNGDPSILFQPDLKPLSEAEGEQLIGRLAWMGAEVEELVSGLSQEQLAETPRPKGRSIQAIREHVLEAEVAYMRAFGRLEGLPGPGSIVKKREGELLGWIRHVRSREFERLRALSRQERSQVFVHWKVQRTARKVMRRMLEHQWEHLVELKERLAVA